LNTMPGFGKSGTSRMKDFNDSALDSKLMAGSLTDVEALTAAWLYLDPLDGGDLRERRPLAEPLLELLQHGIVSLGDDLDRPVGQVAGEPRHPEPLRLPQDEVAIADTLHAAAHEEPARGHH
jgi:hypothetical protein